MKIHFKRVVKKSWFKKYVVWESHNINRWNIEYVVEKLKDLNFKKIEQKYMDGDGFAGDAHWVEISFNKPEDEAFFILNFSDGVEI